MSREIRDAKALRRVKFLHTLIWVWFAGCILALPVAAWLVAFRLAWLLIAIVFVKVVVLALNHWRCPLTAVAARHTHATDANFDILLPMWLAQYNKVVFGAIYIAGVDLTVLRWRSWR